MNVSVSSSLKQQLTRFTQVSLGILLFTVPALAQTPPTTATTGTSKLALDTMLQSFVANISGPIEQIVLCGGYIFGIYLLVKGLFKCIKYSDEGSKGQQKFSGIWGTFMVGAMLIALPSMMTTVGMSLFGSDTGFTSFNSLSYGDPTGNLNTDATAHVNNVIAVILVLLQMVGIISFTRGLSILRSVTDGNTQVTSMAGLTHVIAGALCWNFAGWVNTISDTVCSGHSIVNGCA